MEFFYLDVDMWYQKMRNLMENSGYGLKKSNIKKCVCDNTEKQEKAFHFHSKNAVFHDALVWQQPHRGLI